MRKLIWLMFFFAACGVAPAWDGNPTSCDFVYRGACIQGLSLEDTEKGFEYAERIFGEIDASGFLIHSVSKVTICGEAGTFDGCEASATKEIQIAGSPKYCAAFLITHELGHVKLNDAQHHNPEWSVLENDYYEICPTPYPLD